MLLIPRRRIAGRERGIPRRLLRRIAGLRWLRIPLWRLLRILRLGLLGILRSAGRRPLWRRLTLRRRVVAGSLLPRLLRLPRWLLTHDVPFPVAMTRSHRRRSTEERGRWCPEQTAATSAGDGEDNGTERQRRPQRPGLLPIRSQ